MKINDRRRRAAGMIAAAAAGMQLLPRTTWAQTWPERPIRLVVGFAPGGFTDVLARLIGARMQDKLGQPVVVENRPGAAGTLGADIVAKAAPDGYTLLLGHSNSNAVAPALYSRLPYDVLKDFTPIVRIATTPLLLTIHPSVPAADVASFVKLARDQPGDLRFASSGVGSSQHLAAARFMLATGTQMTHVPYKGSGQAIVDLLSGQVQLNFESPPNVLAHVRAGKLKSLAITSDRRSPLLPDVPTMAEAGVQHAEMLQWFALMGPAGLPAPLVSQLNALVIEILHRPEVAGKIAEQGGELVDGPAEQFATFLKTDTEGWAKLVRDAGVRLD